VNFSYHLGIFWRKQVLDSEVDQVFAASDIGKTGELDHDECLLAVSVWSSMRQDKEYFDGVFKK
jgi:hypothetical protein